MLTTTLDQTLETPHQHNNSGAWTADLTIEHALSSFIDEQSMEPALRQAMLYATGLDSHNPRHRGKRVRPMLCLLTCRGLGVDISSAMPLAVSCELVHSFLLVHDDIQDGDERRRGRESVWRRFGLAEGVNIGDLLGVLSQKALLAADWDQSITLQLLRLVNDTLFETGQGQAMDIAARGQLISRDDYLRTSRQKTGRYLALPMTGAAILAHANAHILNALLDFASAVGPMFQIVDDIIDITDGKGRGERGADIREGKRSLLVILALERSDDDQRRRLLDILDTPRQQTSQQQVAWVLDLFVQLDIVAAAWSEADRFLSCANAALQRLPAPLRDRLQAAATGLSRRKT